MLSSSNKNDKNWYKDKYNNLLVQRNFLLIAIVIFSAVLLVCVSILSRFQRSDNVKPYIIEYNNNTGLLSVVEIGRAHV